MTPEQEQHLQFIKDEFVKLSDSKYRRGQLEHGGDLWKKDGILDMAIEEAIDLPIYLLSLKQKMESIRLNKGWVINWDLDKTLCYGSAWLPEDCQRCEPKIENINKLNEQSKDHYIIIFTARRDELLCETVKWLRQHNVRYHAISNQKPPGLYVDEEALRPEDI